MLSTASLSHINGRLHGYKTVNLRGEPDREWGSTRDLTGRSGGRRAAPRSRGGGQHVAPLRHSGRPSAALPEPVGPRPGASLRSVPLWRLTSYILTQNVRFDGLFRYKREGLSGELVSDSPCRQMADRKEGTSTRMSRKNLLWYCFRCPGDVYPLPPSGGEQLLTTSAIWPLRGMKWQHWRVEFNFWEHIFHRI